MFLSSISAPFWTSLWVKYLRRWLQAKPTQTHTHTHRRAHTHKHTHTHTHSYFCSCWEIAESRWTFLQRSRVKSCGEAAWVALFLKCIWRTKSENWHLRMGNKLLWLTNIMHSENDKELVRLLNLGIHVSAGPVSRSDRLRKNRFWGRTHSARIFDHSASTSTATSLYNLSDHSCNSKND